MTSAAQIEPIAEEYTEGFWKALYRKFDFVEEGVKRRARYLDGEWDDFTVMARVVEE